MSKRGAYVVMQSPNKDFYCIVNALKNQRVVLTHIFQKSVAQTLCASLNHRNKPNNPHEAVSELRLSHCQHLLNRYADLYTESVFHRYTIKTTKREFMRDVAFVRLHETILKLKHISKISKTYRFFSSNAFNLFSFYECDHGYRDQRSIKTFVAESLSKYKIKYQNLNITAC